MAIKAFKRYELKYFVSEEQFNIICKKITNHMTPDDYCQNGGSYMIYNLYFDTAAHDVIRYSSSKPYYKEKLRLRSYRLLAEDREEVFLELKKKIGGVVAKRRAVMTYADAMDFIRTGNLPMASDYQDIQVIGEIKEFLSRYRVMPMVFISYERTAFFDKENKDFRISFDREILTRRTKVSLLEGDFGTELILDRNYLMEVKCDGAMPLWLCHLLSSLGVYKTSFSKYGTEYKKFRVC